MDLSQLSTEDLLALKGGDLSKVSTQGLHQLRQAQIATQIDNDPISQGARDPTAGMSFLDKFNAGAGKAVSDIGLGVRQALGFASKQDVQESRKLDAPLMRTGAGIAGNIGGNVAMLAPSAVLSGGSVPAAAAINGTIGWLQPYANDTEHAISTFAGAAGGAIGQYGANAAADRVATQQANNAATAVRATQKQGAAQNASAAGYVIPPEDLGNTGLVTKLLQGAGGKIKTAQVASERNQGVTNDLVRQELGIAATEPLNVKTLQAVRDAAGNAYDTIKNTGTVTADQAYSNALANIAQKYNTAAQAFPGAVKNDIPDLVTALNQPSFSADAAVNMTKILRKGADKAFAQGDSELGNAYRQASSAMEDMLDRHLQAQNLPDALQAFREARSTIAKTYSVQKGLNTTTGDVAAGALAKQLDKGKPLSGNLLQIAETAQAFPKATQALKEAPKTFSPLDMALAAVKGDPMGLLTLGARPAARSILLSAPMQESAIEGMTDPRAANLLYRIASNQALTVPAASLGAPAAGNALARYLIGD